MKIDVQLQILACIDLAGMEQSNHKVPAGSQETTLTSYSGQIHHSNSIYSTKNCEGNLRSALDAITQ